MDAVPKRLGANVKVMNSFRNLRSLTVGRRGGSCAAIAAFNRSIWSRVTVSGGLTDTMTPGRTEFKKK